jgi:hypothetical protein
MLDWINETWDSITSSTVWEYWTDEGGYIWDGLFTEKGILDNKPLKEFLHGKLDGKEFKRYVAVAAVDIETGVFYPMNSIDHGDNFAEAIAASASIPGVFPDTVIDGKMLVDGSTAWNNNMVSAFDECMRRVGDPSKITLDAILLDPAKIDPIYSSSVNAGLNWNRFRELTSYYQTFTDLKSWMHA